MVKGPSAMKICISVNFLQELTGSELLAIELANECVAAGCDVDILAYKLDVDFARSQLNAAVKCFTDLDNYDFHTVDIFYFQHQMGSVILPFLLDILDEDDDYIWPYLIFSHISINAEIETPGLYTEELFYDEIWCNSEETRQNLITKYGPRFDVARVFYNAAPRCYETEIALQNAESLTHILAVSNHFSDEIVRALEILETKGVRVKRRGKQFDAARITADDISETQAVLTIGKTVQYALRAQRPIYCFDIYGGPGWLDANNFEKAGYHNFSGRCGPRMLTASDIADELMTGFQNAAVFSKEIEKSSLKKYELEHLVAEFLGTAKNSRIDESRQIQTKSLTQDDQTRGHVRLEADIAETILKFSTNRTNMLKNSQNLRDHRDRLKLQVIRLGERVEKLKARLQI